MEIGRRIKEARESKGLTQQQLADKLTAPLTATAISLYEKGSRDVPVDVLSEIAKLTDASFEYLASGTLTDGHTIQVALRADKDLYKNEHAQKQVLDFIEFVKKTANGKK